MAENSVGVLEWSRWEDAAVQLHNWQSKVLQTKLSDCVACEVHGSQVACGWESTGSRLLVGNRQS